MNKSHIFLNRRLQRGFTLVELLVVLAIIAILAAITLSALRTAREKAFDAQIKSDMTQIRNALELYAGANGYLYPALAQVDAGPNLAEERTIKEETVTDTSFISRVSHTVASFFVPQKALAQSRNLNCQYFDNLVSVLSPTYMGSIPKHPLDNGVDVCYKYFVNSDRTVATAYGSLVTDKFSNGSNKQIGIVIGRTDIDTLKSICTENKSVANTPFPLFSVPGGSDICNGDSVADIVIGVSNGEGDLSSDSYI